MTHTFYNVTQLPELVRIPLYTCSYKHIRCTLYSKYLAVSFIELACIDVSAILFPDSFHHCIFHWNSMYVTCNHTICQGYTSMWTTRFYCRACCFIILLLRNCWGKNAMGTYICLCIYIYICVYVCVFCRNILNLIFSSKKKEAFYDIRK